MNPKVFVTLIALIPSLLALALGAWSPPVLAVPTLGTVVLFLGMEVMPSDEKLHGIMIKKAPGWVPGAILLLLGFFLACVIYGAYLAIR